VSTVVVQHGQRRVVVCVAEVAPASRRLLEDAARLAARLESELVAAFFGNPALLWSAALPFTRAVSRFGLADHDFDVANARRALRLMAAEVRRLAAELARQAGIACAFLELESGPGLSVLQPGDVLVAEADALRALRAAVGIPALPAGTALVVRGRRPGPLIALSAGEPTTLALVDRLRQESGLEVVVHLIDANVTAPMPGQAGPAVPPSVRIRRSADLHEALKAATTDIIELGAGGVIVDGALAAMALAPLLAALEGRHVAPSDFSGPRADDEPRASSTQGPTG
jgi:hypothetical protein